MSVYILKQKKTYLIGNDNGEVLVIFSLHRRGAYRSPC